MWSKHFDRITFIKEREVAVNLISKHGLFGQVWRAFVFEYGQVVFQSRCQDCHLRERYRSLPALSYHVQFHASWCGVCRKEMPFIEKDIWLKHKDNKAFALFGVDRDEPLETVVAFAKRTGVTYPLALDPGADIFARYADRKAGITRNVLIDKTGKIVMLTRLYNEEEFSSLCKKIDEMLGEK